MGSKFTFAKATKQQSLLRLGLVAPSGAGKTWTSLVIGCEIARIENSRAVLIDTEQGSASKYADRFDFDTLILDDFAPHNYVEALTAAEDAGYKVIILDSATHAWDAILEEKDRKSKGGNSWAGWSDLSPKYRAFIDKQVRCRAHLIVTMRAKTAWVLEEKNGKQVPRKVGMGASVRPGYEYEYDIVGYLDLDHDLTIEKTRYAALDGKHWARPDEKFAQGLYEWLKTGEPRKAPPEPKVERISDEQQKRIFALMHEHGKSRDEVKAILDRHGFAASADITIEKYDAICHEIAAKKPSEQ